MKIYPFPAFTALMRWLLLLAVSTLGVLTPTATPVVHADGGYAYYWSLTFDFEQSLNGVLLVTVGHNEDGGVQEPPLYRETFNVNCRRVGNVVLVGGSARFNGGYLQCDLDVKSALVATFEVCNKLHPGCTMPIGDVERYRNFRMLAGAISPAVGSAPLFYHEDAAYTITPDTANTQVAATLTPVGALSSSPVVALLGTPQFYAAEYECDGGCEMFFTISGAMQSTPVGTQVVEFSTPSTTIYIGYNPSTGGTMPAGTDLMHLFVDPPNFGNH